MFLKNLNEVVCFFQVCQSPHLWDCHCSSPTLQTCCEIRQGNIYIVCYFEFLEEGWDISLSCAGTA